MSAEALYCANCAEMATNARQGRWWRVDGTPYWLCHACTKRVMAGWIRRNLLWGKYDGQKTDDTATR